MTIENNKSNASESGENKSPKKSRRRFIIGWIILGVSLLVMFFCLNKAITEDASEEIQEMDIDEETVIDNIVENLPAEQS
ncbi:MAG: hypothetical protein K2G64_02295 [Muribaculaceae bacterium]|nr:hypothetical protein [Muribaculaceae bacterium]MDE5967913.1 hypothetical protein [Muribaculaceae bacterium]